MSVDYFSRGIVFALIVVPLSFDIFHRFRCSRGAIVSWSSLWRNATSWSDLEAPDQTGLVRLRLSTVPDQSG